MRDLAGEILPENVNNDHLFGLATGAISGCPLTVFLFSLLSVQTTSTIPTSVPTYDGQKSFLDFFRNLFIFLIIIYPPLSSLANHGGRLVSFCMSPFTYVHTYTYRVHHATHNPPRDVKKKRADFAATGGNVCSWVGGDVVFI